MARGLPTPACERTRSGLREPGPPATDANPSTSQTALNRCATAGRHLRGLGAETTCPIRAPASGFSFGHYVRVWYFDGYAWPGWHDYLGLAIAVAGFWIAIDQIVRSRHATDRATQALGVAQKHLTERSIMAVVPHFQSVSEDLNYALPANNVEVAHRTLVRFSLMAKEASGILTSMGDDHAGLAVRLDKAADSATKAKGKMLTEPEPNVIVIVKAVAADIDKLGQELAGLSASLRNTVEGTKRVQ